MNKQVFHARIWSKLLAYNRKHALIRPKDRILAAVSGGPDSVCLAHFLHRLSQRLGLQLRFVHLHHGLRGRDADRDAHAVEALGKKFGVPVSVRRIPVSPFAKSSRRSLEDAGRTLRYRALLQAARKYSFNKIATGHQMDDQAETLLLNLLRGTRAKGLAGMPPSRRMGRSIRIIRPLLALSRQEVLNYLKYHRLSYRTDKTNRSLKFTRNWMRLKVLPLLETRNPGIREHLAQIAEELSAGRT
jgi:tRNA(Ile)-lysidine synthase